MRITRLWTPLAIGIAGACAPARVVTTSAPVPMAGSHIRYTTTTEPSNFVTARLISLDGDHLVVERLVPAQPAGTWVTVSLATESVDRLQVRVGRRSNPGRGALIGAAVGVLSGIGCATQDQSWAWEQPSDGECFALGIAGGAGTGALIGLFIHSDVWAPVPLPHRDGELVAETLP